MTWIIAKRELLSNVITFRFLIGLILCLVLITASAFVLTKDYQVRLESYNKNVRSNNDGLENIKVHSDVRANAHKLPCPLEFLCVGSDKQLGNTVADISYREVPREASQSSGSPLINVFPSLDITLIIQVVLSLFAVLLAYDAISGEREMGTLAVMLSNSVPRHHVLLGKLLGGMITIAIPLTAGVLVGLLVTLIYGSTTLNASAWVRIGLVYICSLLYLSVVFMLGILVSARTRRSATSLVILLFVWVASVMLLPNVGPYVARRIQKVEDKAVVDAKREALDSEFWRKTYQFGDEQRKAGKFPPDLWRFMNGKIVSYTNPYPMTIGFASRENMIWFLGGLRNLVPLHMEYADRIWDLYRVYEQELRKQAALSDNLSRTSPAWIYYNVASILAGTDSSAHTRFMDQARRYRRQLIDYSRAQKGFSDMSFFTTMKMDETPTFAQLAEIESEQGAKVINGLKSSYWNSATPLKDIPEFHYQTAPLTDSIERALPDLFILALLNIVFFLTTYASFVRQEVK